MKRSWGARRALRPQIGCVSRCGRYNHPVPRPLSKSALERLGRRLVVDQPDRADIEQLHVLLAAYGPVLAAAVQAVAADVGQSPSSRERTQAPLRRSCAAAVGILRALSRHSVAKHCWPRSPVRRVHSSRSACSGAASSHRARNLRPTRIPSLWPGPSDDARAPRTATGV